MISLRIPRVHQIYPRFLSAVVIAALIVAFPNYSSAYKRGGKAIVVQAEDGTPCFTIDPKDEERGGIPLLGALVVSDTTAKPPIKVWSFGIITSDRTIPISSKECIRYGQAPCGAEVTKNSVKLKPGRIYEVFLNAKFKNPYDPTHGFDGLFCLVKQPDGRLKVHQVIFDEAKGEWLYNPCNPK